MIKLQKCVQGAFLTGIALALSSCSANPGPVMSTATDKLISYFEAKQDLADTLQRYLGGPTQNSIRNEFYAYRLVAINGPAYPVGSLLAADNQLDVITRDCEVDFESGRYGRREQWSSFPRWSSENTLDVALGIPAPFRGMFNKAESSLDTGVKFESASIYQLEDITQTFLSRTEMSEHMRFSGCGKIIDSLNEPVIFVRGIIYGRETLRSARGFSGGVNARVVEGDSGELRLSYDSSGAYELEETELVPKFAIMAKLDPADPAYGGVGAQQRDIVMYANRLRRLDDNEIDRLEDEAQSRLPSE